MKTDNPFDKKLELLQKAGVGRVPPGLVDASVFVTDTLDLCVAAADAIFEEKATPELALAIYDRVVARMAANPEE